MDLPKIIDLFESKHTADLTDRQANTIIQYCKSSFKILKSNTIEQSVQSATILLII